jgi:hypothetical protein
MQIQEDAPIASTAIDEAAVRCDYVELLRREEATHGEAGRIYPSRNEDDLPVILE